MRQAWYSALVNHSIERTEVGTEQARRILQLCAIQRVMCFEYLTGQECVRVALSGALGGNHSIHQPGNLPGSPTQAGIDVGPIDRSK